MPIIYPTDTSGTKWHKLGEISKGLGVLPDPVYPLVYPTVSLAKRLVYNSNLFNSSANAWRYNDSEYDVVLTVATVGPAPMLVGQEVYLYQASTGTITINPGSCTVIGPLATTGAGQLLVLKKITSTLLYSYFKSKPAPSVSVDVAADNPFMGVTRDNSMLVYYTAEELGIWGPGPFAIWRASFYNQPTTITCENPIYLTWKAHKDQSAATNLNIDGVVYDQRVAGEHLVTAGAHTIGPVETTYSSPYISGLRTP